jgi:hypothetical protein
MLGKASQDNLQVVPFWGMCKKNQDLSASFLVIQHFKIIDFLRESTFAPPCPPILGGSDLKVPQHWGI